MPGPGRPAREAMERLVRIATVLHHHPEQGVDADTLCAVAGFDGPNAADQLSKDLKHLRSLGWQIDNIAAFGSLGQYRMTTVDNRLSLRLTPEQQQALQRAVLLADRADLVSRLGLPATSAPEDVVAIVPQNDLDDRLKVVVRALQRSCRLTFRYNGADRVVHPASMRSQNGTWYLRGREEGGQVVKAFVVSRMSDVQAAAPGTADRVERERHEGLHPMSWQVDPPTEVTLRAPAQFADDVRRWLGAPRQQVEEHGVATFVYDVTNRAALRRRIVELGTRVELVGPDDVRRELLDELAEMGAE